GARRGGGRAPSTRAGGRVERLADELALLAVVACLAVYGLSNPDRPNLYNHFVWQAAAWLEGEVAIPYPVEATADSPGNAFFQDVMPIAEPTGEEPGRALVPFPPFPAVVLLPFVAVFGMATNAQLIASVVGALDVGLAVWVLGRLGVRPPVRLATVVFFGLGTVLWAAAMDGETWYFAHVVAVGLTLLSIGTAIGGDPDARAEALAATAAVLPTRLPLGGGEADVGAARAGSGLRLPAIDRRQAVAGFLLGLAATARLPVAFGLPFLALVGSGGGWLGRTISAAAGAAIPLALLGGYNLLSTGHLFHPAYAYLHEIEVGFYPLLFPYLEYHPEWGMEDPRYLLQNLRLMLLAGPLVLPPCPPGATRGLFDPACPLIVPRDDGLSLLLTSPGYLLALPALRALRTSRLVAGAALAIGAVAVVNLMHFSQGWVQFGYRFSNDFAPFALLLVALGVERLGGVRRLVVALVGASVVVNLWGVVWANLLGW
ncbi:MAG TPA: hypothetical protein VNJ28_04315, partial [Candidatus Limnocylindrales bacterium]|nr:hypothetical protein [Candidatus Limnocylindrales bacterium]